jgi:hypothetical protein
MEFKAAVRRAFLVVASAGFLAAAPAVWVYGQQTQPEMPPGLSPGDVGNRGSTAGTMSAAPGGYEGGPLAGQTPDVDPATGPVPFGESFSPPAGPVENPAGSTSGPPEGPGSPGAPQPLEFSGQGGGKRARRSKRASRRSEHV